jgi:hypothetical protein
VLALVDPDELRIALNDGSMLTVDQARVKLIGPRPEALERAMSAAIEALELDTEAAGDVYDLVGSLPQWRELSREKTPA